MSDQWIAISPEPLQAASALAFVNDAQTGAVSLFVGTTRADQNDAGQPLIALDYEAYVEMAHTQLQQFAAAARQRWPITKCALLHRIGRVPLGEPSVVIAVSTPHRNESFDACRWLIDTLKAQAAIWKKEVWSK